MTSRIQPSSDTTNLRMSNIGQTGTAAEVAIRRELFRRGLRYREDFKVLTKPRRVADMTFPRQRIAIFVDGCFWHGCPDHATWPKRNAEFWRQKIKANRRRDVNTNLRLRELGWTVLRFWEHEDAKHAANVIEQHVTMARLRQRGSAPGPTTTSKRTTVRTWLHQKRPMLCEIGVGAASHM